MRRRTRNVRIIRGPRLVPTVRIPFLRARPSTIPCYLHDHVQLTPFCYVGGRFVKR